MCNVFVGPPQSRYYLHVCDSVLFLYFDKICVNNFLILLILNSINQGLCFINTVHCCYVPPQQAVVQVIPQEKL